MSSTVITSPNMNLQIPVTSVDTGPDYANNVNACLLTLDSHNHSSGQGVQIGPSGIVINADLAYLGNNAISLRSARFTAQGSPLSAAADYLSVSVSGVDLYYLDGNGNAIQITKSGGVNGSPGSIGSLVSPASATYVSATPAFVFQSDVNTPANLDGGALVIRNVTASSKGITISPPNALAADYAVTMPAALPSAQYLLSLDNTGVIANAINISSGIPSSAMQTNINLPGNSVFENSRTLVVASFNAATSLAILRGVVASDGSITSGEGFTVSHGATGQYTITFSHAFGDAPTVVASLSSGIAVGFINTVSAATGSVSVNIWNSSASSADRGFSFLAIGQRA